MLNRNVNPNGTITIAPNEMSFKDLNEIMKAKAEQTIDHTVAAIECHVEQLEEDVFSDRPTYGCNIAERVSRHRRIKAILTQSPGSSSDRADVWEPTTLDLMTKIHDARVAVDQMLTEVNRERRRLGGLLGQDPPTLDEMTNDESVRELKFIEDNLANGPDDPDYDELSR